MKVGLLTGGGDCPGLNAVIRAVVQQLANEGLPCLGILEGWRGLVQNMTCPLTLATTDGIIAQGGAFSARLAPILIETRTPTWSPCAITSPGWSWTP